MLELIFIHFAHFIFGVKVVIMMLWSLQSSVG